MKKLLFIFFSLLSFSCFANSTPAVLPNCVITPVTWPITNVAIFLNGFEEVAYCRCAQEGFGEAFCRQIGMRQIYLKMIGLYQTRENACAAQHIVAPALCVEQWHTYCSYRPDICPP